MGKAHGFLITYINIDMKKQKYKVRNMLKNKTIANAGWIIVCKIVQSILGVIISMLTARYLGPSNFGLINFAASVVAFVTPLTTLGLGYVIVQELLYSPESEGKIVGTSFVMSLFSSMLCIGGVITFSIISDPNDTEAIIVCALYSLLLFAKAFEIVQYWFQAKLLSKYSSIVSLIAYFLISVYKIFLLATNKSIYWFAVSNAIDHLIIGITLLYICKKKCKQRFEFDFSCAKKLFRKSKYFIVSSMMVTIFAQMDKIMLKFMIGEEATGIYSAAYACAGVTSFIFAAIIDSMRPAIIENKKRNESTYEKSMCGLYSIIICFSLLQSLLMTVCASPLISILYGNEYEASITILRLIVWYTTFSYLGAARSVWILAEEKQQYLWIINLTGAILNVVLNMVLIPIWGVEGAAIATVITQLCTNFVIGFVLKPLRPAHLLMLKSMNPKFIIDTIKHIKRSF